MRGCAEIKFHLPILNRFLLTVFLQSVLDAFFDSQSATRGVSGAISKEALGKFIVCIAFASFFELRDSPEMSCGVMEFSEFINLVPILFVLFVIFFLFGLEIAAVIAWICS